MKDKLLAIGPRAAMTLFVALDVFTIGLGMGVPFFTILLGAPVGWFAARRADADVTRALRECFRTALLSSAVSLVVLAIIWLPWLPVAWGPESGLEKTGVPLILYTPRASLVGWLALMVLVSPMAQALVTIAFSQLTLMRRGAAGYRAAAGYVPDARSGR